MDKTLQNKPVSSPFKMPEPDEPKRFSNAAAAVAELQKRYEIAICFLQSAFADYLKNPENALRYRATYPALTVETTTHARIDSKLSYGHVSEPGIYQTTITRPDLFNHYLEQQINLLMDNHGVDVIVEQSEIPIPIHFAFDGNTTSKTKNFPENGKYLRDHFDTPELAVMDDAIVNGDFFPAQGKILPLAPFTGPRIDYSLHRLAHYTGTEPQHFQNYILFTNYQFYVDRFVDYAHQQLIDDNSLYNEFIAPGNLHIRKHEYCADSLFPDIPSPMPQMPAFHLKAPNNTGITLINIGVGPSNAKTITDHVAVIRPHCWLMLGHCAGLRNTQSLGDLVLAHGYVREDHVLDADLPLFVPIPPLAEIQVALQEAVAEVTELTDFNLKNIMRTGTVATIDNRNWELRDQTGPVKRLSQSRAIALDMESATIAANGFRLRVPYGTLLCVSDKPLHGELKLPGMASEFYRTQIDRHLLIGIKALERLRQMSPERLHSRKLRAFDETAFQ